MTIHEQDTVAVTVNLNQSELQTAITFGIKTALRRQKLPKEPQPMLTSKGKATGAFAHQWRGKAQW